MADAGDQQIIDIFDSPDVGNGLGSPVTGTSGSGNFVGISTSNPGAAVTSMSPLAVVEAGISSSFNNFAKSILGGSSLLSGGATASGAGNLINAAVNGTGAANAVNATSSLVSALFLRGVVIITGFIFLAVGLSMFKGGQNIVVQVAGAPGRAIKKGIGG